MSLPKKPLIHLLFETTGQVFREQIQMLMQNFPKSEENQTHLTENIYNYFKCWANFDVSIVKLIDRYCALSSVDFKLVMESLLRFFVQIPLNLENCDFVFPVFFTIEMKESSLTSFEFRASSFFVMNNFFTNLIFQFVKRDDILRNNEFYTVLYCAINSILFHETSEKNSYRMQIINVSKWSRILSIISKNIPDIVLSDAFNHIQSSQMNHNYYHIFILKLYSALYYPPEIFDNFSLIFVTFQQLLSILNLNRSNHLLIAGNEFIRNFLGYTLLCKQTSDSFSLYKDISKFYGKIQNDQCSWNSTIVLFATLSRKTASFFSISRFMSTTTKQFPVVQFKIADVLKTFTTIIKGESYSPIFQPEKIIYHQTKGPPSKASLQFNINMIEIIMSNRSSFKQVQKELSIFMIQLAAVNIKVFMQHQINNFLEDDFFQHNTEAILHFAISMLYNEAYFVERSNIDHGDQNFIQFKNQMKKKCQHILEHYSVDSSTIDVYTYVTNSFTDSVSLNSLEDEIDHLIQHTTCKPVMGVKTFPIFKFFIGWKNNIPDKQISFANYVNNINENGLKTYKSIPTVNNVIILTLYLCLFLFPQNESQVFNKIPMFLFSDSPFISAITMRLLQAFIHKNKNTFAVESLLTIQVQKYEELYIFGAALLKTVESLVANNINLTIDLASSILAWECVLIAAPYIVIREFGFELAKTVTPILPPNIPNLNFILEKYEREISRQSINMFISMFYYDHVDLELITFREVSRTSSYLLYHIFLANTFRKFDVEYGAESSMYHIKNMLHAQVMTLINAKPVDDAFLANAADCHFVLNLMTLRLTTTSKFDKYTAPPQIISLLKEAEKILKCIEPNTRMFLSFFVSINPGLKLTPQPPKTGIYLLVLCFSMRILVEQRSVESIEESLRAVVDYLDRRDIISKDISIPIALPSFRDDENGLFPMSLNHMMCALKVVFKKIRKNSEVKNNGIFLRVKQYNREIDQPFDPNVWFPFLFKLASLSPDFFPKLKALADKVVSIYATFVTIPSRMVMSAIDEILNIRFTKFLTTFLLNSPIILMNFYCQKASDNPKMFNAICSCFKPPNNIVDDLLEIRNNLTNSVTVSDFDVTAYENIGSLLAHSFFYLSYSDKAVDRILCINLVYHLSIFAVISNFPSADMLLPVIGKLSREFQTNEFPIPLERLTELSRIHAEVFSMYTEQFLKTMSYIISNRPTDSCIINIILRWFGNVELCTCHGVVPNSIITYFTSHSFLKNLLSLQLKHSYHTIGVNFSQTPLPSESASILEQISRQNPKFIVDFILYEEIDARSVLIFLALYYHDEIIPYLIDYLRFEFAYYKEIQKNEAKLYQNIVGKVLLVFISLLEDNKESVMPYLHLLFVYCYVRALDLPMQKKETVTSLISEILGEKVVEKCINHFTENIEQKDETIHELFLWMVSYHNLKESLLALKIFYNFPEAVVKKKDDILTAIKIVCTLLNQSSNLNECSIFCDYIAESMLLLDFAGEPPNELAFDLLKCNCQQFSPLYKVSLQIISRNIEIFRRRYNVIYVSMINADITQPIAVQIFYILRQFFILHFIDIKKSPDIFLTMIPYIATKENDEQLLSVVGEVSQSVIRNYKSDLFDSFILDLIDEISGDRLYLIMSFFISLVRVCENEYFDIIFQISFIILKQHSASSSLCSSVFTPLTKYLLMNSPNKCEYLDFVTTFHNFCAIVIPNNKILRIFPTLRNTNKVELVFNESLPLILLDQRFNDCRLKDELNVFLFSVQFSRFIQNEKNYYKQSSEELPKMTTIPFDFDISLSIEKIDRILKTLLRKTTNINVDTISGIRKVDCHIFLPTIDIVDEVSDE